MWPVKFWFVDNPEFGHHDWPEGFPFPRQDEYIAFEHGGIEYKIKDVVYFPNGDFDDETPHIVISLED